MASAHQVIGNDQAIDTRSDDSDLLGSFCHYPRPTFSYCLASAGIGTLGIVDNDVVDRSNLQRQILHKEAGTQSCATPVRASLKRLIKKQLQATDAFVKIAFIVVGKAESNKVLHAAAT